MKKLRTERENYGKEFQKKHEDFASIPLRIIQYCGQENPQISADAMMNSRTVKIKVGDLGEYRTACGTKNNRPFTPATITFLKERSPSDFVVAEVYGKEIQNLSVQWNQKDQEANSRKFAEMINANGGSLRPELVFEDGWDCYESE
jgi:hypothetical protein